MGNLLIGIDIGTYSSKGVLVDSAGSVLKHYTVNHQMDIPRPGWAEQDADEVWWKDVITICHSLLDGSPYSGNEVAGIAVSAIGPCMLPLNAEGKPLRKGILYGVDTRAIAEIDYLNRRIGEERIFDFSGMALSSQAVGPKILWLKNHEPDVWKEVEHITTASSYIIYKLTGEMVIDRHTASHYMPLIDIETLQWSDRYTDEIIGIDKLPRLGWSDEVAGHVSPRGANATGLKVGTPVAVGAVDALSEAISVGVVNSGDLMIMYGSTTFFILVLNALISDRRLWSVAGSYRGQYNLAAGMATAGSLTRWFRDEFAKDLPEETAFDRLFSAAESVAPGADGVLALPYFSGERTPINDPKARGVIAGLSLAHNRKHLYRALLEAVAFGIRHNIETFRSIGAEVNRVIAVGGGTKNNTWPQIVSDVSGLSQVVPDVTIGASYGDAFLAGLAAGIVKRNDLLTWIKPGYTVKPNDENRQIYDRLYQQYLNLYNGTRDIVHDLSSGSAAKN